MSGYDLDAVLLTKTSMAATTAAVYRALLQNAGRHFIVDLQARPSDLKRFLQDAIGPLVDETLDDPEFPVVVAAFVASLERVVRESKCSSDGIGFAIDEGDRVLREALERAGVGESRINQISAQTRSLAAAYTRRGSELN